MSELKGLLEVAISESGVVWATLVRLRERYPECEWSFNNDHCLYQDELFLHFAESTERRMWWVLVDSGDGDLAMSWNMEGMSDLV